MYYVYCILNTLQGLWASASFSFFTPTFIFSCLVTFSRKVFHIYIDYKLGCGINIKLKTIKAMAKYK